MNMPTAFVRVTEALNEGRLMREVRQQNALLKRQVSLLQDEVQAATDITTNTDSTGSKHYTGTPSRYNSYEAQVVQLGLMYDNVADWGCMIARNIIDMRTAFSVGGGIRVIKRETFEGQAERELEWAEDFMQQNNLDEEMPQEYAKEAEIEGKVLFRFLVDKPNQFVRLTHVPWLKFHYEVLTPENDFLMYARAVYTGSGEAGITFDLSSDRFVYKRFGGVSSKPNITPPKTSFVLREMEDLDKAIWDWRKVNRLFSMPTPVIMAPDKQTAKDINESLAAINWRIGKLIVFGGQNVKFELVGWKGDGYTTLKEETQSLVKTISGTTGIPVHFLGYPELLSNRDTAENLSQLIALSTSKERRTWVGAYEEIFQKAMRIHNRAFGTNLNPQAIDVELMDLMLTPVEAEGEPDAPISESNNTSPRESGA